MWRLIINFDVEEQYPPLVDLYFKTVKDICFTFPFIKKNMVYDVRKRNNNKWAKNKQLYDRLKIIKL